MSIAGNILQAAVGSALSAGGGSGEWYSMAMDLVGNEGQATLIEEIGSDFDDVYADGVESEGDFSACGDLSSHPEAISDILGEVEGAMTDKFIANEQASPFSFSVMQEISMIDAVFF